MRLAHFLIAPLVGLVLIAPIGAADKPTSTADPAPLTKVPQTLQELKDLQQRVQEVYKKVLPAVVGVQIGGASGSGVIVTEDGYVLTAGHVSGKPDTECTLIMPDGKRVKAKSLGANKIIDSGMFKITEPGKWPHVPMGDSTTLAKGQWVVSLGHPNGYISGRTPVLRLGRVQNATDKLIQTDCTLVGGDSGGPLFDLDGKVIGIHSRIGPSISFNIHVPVSTYQETWDDLVAGRVWNRFGPATAIPANFDLGARFELIGGVLKVAEVKSGSLADKAGLKPRDLIASFDGKVITTTDDIRAIISKKKSGESVVLEVDRGAERLTLKLILNT